MTASDDVAIDELASRLAPHYSRFRVHDRLLFTGHSHQAWPDVAAAGLHKAFDHAAACADEKWEEAFAQAELLRGYLRSWYQDPDGCYGLGTSTHQLLGAWLSALKLEAGTKLVTTDCEFHSMRRQLLRLAEAGVAIDWVPIEPLDTLAERVLAACDGNTAAVLMSHVFFANGVVNPHLPAISESLRRRGIPLLIDDYHGTNVVPLALGNPELSDCYLVTGGYKYLQWGEGNCFLRYPRDCELRPVLTGWFAAFDHLEHGAEVGPLHYDRGDWRFASGTYDSSSQYRAGAVVDFFRMTKLCPATLRSQSRRQLSMMWKGIEALDLPADSLSFANGHGLELNGGFLALRTPHASALCEEMREAGVLADWRGEVIRLGPAPYTSSAQIRAGLDALARAARRVRQ